MSQARNIPQDDRIEIPVSTRDLQLLEKAQVMSGDQTLSGFALRVLKAYAETIIAENERILASEHDRNVFFHAVMGDLSPNEALKTAANTYHKKVWKGED